MKKQDVIELFGSPRDVAAALGISVQAVHRWGDTIPPLRAYQVREIIRAEAGQPGQMTQ